MLDKILCIVFCDYFIALKTLMNWTDDTCEKYNEDIFSRYAYFEIFCVKLVSVQIKDNRVSRKWLKLSKFEKLANFL